MAVWLRQTMVFSGNHFPRTPQNVLSKLLLNLPLCENVPPLHFHYRRGNKFPLKSKFAKRHHVTLEGLETQRKQHFNQRKTEATQNNTIWEFNFRSNPTCLSRYPPTSPGLQSTEECFRHNDEDCTENELMGMNVLIDFGNEVMNMTYPIITVQD